MIETTDTKGDFPLFPVGHYRFTVEQIPEKKISDGGKALYIFRFVTTFDGQLKKYKETFAAWKCGELLKALGAKELEKDKWEWDREAVVGRIVEADIAHEPDKKGKLWPRMKNITEEVPF